MLNVVTQQMVFNVRVIIDHQIYQIVNVVMVIMMME